MSKSNGKSNGEADTTEPLSTYQKPELTGRTDGDQHEPTSGKKNKIDLSKITVRTVKLVDDDYLEITFKQKEADGTKGNDSYDNPERPAHPDFREALDALRVHWGLLATFLEYGKKKSAASFTEDELSKFTVKGISMGKNEDDPGIVITGMKERWDKKMILVNTPFERFDVEDGVGHKFIEELKFAVDVVLNEAKEYIGGKRDKKFVQGKLDIPTPDKAAPAETPEQK